MQVSFAGFEFLRKVHVFSFFSILAILILCFKQFVLFFIVSLASCCAQDADDDVDQLDIDLGASREGSRTGTPHFPYRCIMTSMNLNFVYNNLLTDAEVVKREEEAIKLDGLNVAQVKELREKSEKFAFQAEVNRMMKLIINSLYRNKEVKFFIILPVLHQLLLIDINLSLDFLA